MLRRDFIYQSLLAVGGTVLSSNFISFRRDDSLPFEAVSDDLKETNFDYGVASFDPTSSQVIIWTRYSTPRASIPIAWQVAKDPEFKKIIRSGQVITDHQRDYTVSVEIRELESGQKLYYRFMQLEDKTVSEVGETITFPENPEQLSLAVCSCSNYPAGLFNLYEAIAKSDVDVVLHLGDYIYEYGRGQYGTNQYTAKLNREVNPSNELLSLEDYRTRYKQYRSDKHLKLVHQKKPFICVWDDHEIANDTYKNGAQNHQKSEGDFQTRKQSAIRAYSEYISVRTEDRNKIYRSLTVGNLVNLIMLDTRIIGRDKQLTYNNYFDAQGKFDVPSFQTDLFSPNRTMLGAKQKEWLINTLNNSPAKWQVLGNQVIMGKMYIPMELLPLLNRIYSELHAKGKVSDKTFALFNQHIKELVNLKMRMKKGDTTLTPQEIKRLKSSAPYNLDSWDGYHAEREELLKVFSDKKVVCLSGDSHNAWCNTLITDKGIEAGKEFAVSSISSSGMESLFSNKEQTQGFEQAIQLLIDDLEYFNASKRGFLKVNFTHSQAEADYIFTDSVFTENYQTTKEKSIIYY